MNSILQKFAEASVNKIPTLEPGAKEKVLAFLTVIDEEDHRHWASINTVAKGSKITPMYTRAVLQRLCDHKLVECARHSSDGKLYFRVASR